MNRKVFLNSTSRFKGVCWHEEKKKWHAQIRTRGRKKHLGYFNIEEDAARAYDMAAIREHGEFAKLNFERVLQC